MFKERGLIRSLAIFAGGFLLSAATVWAEPPAPVEKTGNTICNTAGEDGCYQWGVSWPVPRFTDNGDETVTDNLTGLMWTKNANLFGQLNWDAAITAAENLELGPGCVGYSDWRLPNAKELQSLIDLGNHDPALSSGHPFINVQYYISLSSFYWSSTTGKHSPVYAWHMYMYNGYLVYNYKIYDFYVWPVRGPVLAEPPAPVEKTGQINCWDTAGNQMSCEGTGQDGGYQKGVAWPVPRFTDHGDGTVTDNLTGLMWTKDANLFGQKTWAEALTICENMCNGVPPGGCCYNDWRLPNVRELHSLIDYGNHAPALPSGHPFTNIPITYLYYWSSTTGEDYPVPVYAWYVHMRNGNLVYDYKSNEYYVWCVRGGPN